MTKILLLSLIFSHTIVYCAESKVMLSKISEIADQEFIGAIIQKASLSKIDEKGSWYTITAIGKTNNKEKCYELYSSYWIPQNRKKDLYLMIMQEVPLLNRHCATFMYLSPNVVVDEKYEIKNINTKIEDPLIIIKMIPERYKVDKEISQIQFLGKKGDDDILVYTICQTNNHPEEQSFNDCSFLSPIFMRSESYYSIQRNGREYIYLIKKVLL